MEGTPKRSTEERFARIPTRDALRRAVESAPLQPSRYRDHDEVLDKFNVLVSADARQAIALLGHRSRNKTTLWAFERGLDRWEQRREVRDFLAARRTLNRAGSAEVHQFNNWQPVLTGATRYCAYGISKRLAARCADLGRDLGVGTERMAGLCIDAGIVDATIPEPTNHRIAQSLRRIRGDLRDRLRSIERLCDGDSADPPGIITWDAIWGESKTGRKNRLQTISHGHTGRRGTVGNRPLRSLNATGGRETVGNRRER